MLFLRQNIYQGERAVILFLPKLGKVNFYDSLFVNSDTNSELLWLFITVMPKPIHLLENK